MNKKNMILIIIIILFFTIVIIFNRINIKNNYINTVNNNILINEKDKIKEEIYNYLTIMSNNNFDFQFNIGIDNNHFKYNGTKYEDIIAGSYINFENKEYVFQVENNKCYDLRNNNEINNVLLDVNIKYINLNYLSEEIINNNNINCIKTNGIYDCSDDKTGINYSFELKNNNIDTIKIDSSEYNYLLKYSNINQTKILKNFNLNYERFKISYDKTNEIQESHNIKNVDFYYYYVANISFIINNKEINFEKNIDSIKNLAVKTIKYTNNIKKYYFENDIIIIEKTNNINKTYYISTYEHSNLIINNL